MSVNIYETLPILSFNQLTFPVKSISVSAGTRIKRHEFPHVDGGLVEKLGRKMNEVKVTALFHEGVPRYKNLFSATLPAIRSYKDAQDTHDLVVPHLGTLKACIEGWEEKSAGTSGFEVDITWIEDDVNPVRLVTLTEEDTRTIESAAIDWQASVDNFPDQDRSLPLPNGQESGSVFDAITQLTNSIVAIGDQVELYSNLLDKKLAQLISFLQLLNRSFTPYNDPSRYNDLEAFKEFFFRAQSLQKNLRANAPEVDTWMVPRQMTASEAAKEIYGDASRGPDVMGLNPSIEDPFKIPLGQSLYYFRFPQAA